MKLWTWLQFLDGFNGISFWRDEVHVKAEFQVHSDAAGSSRYGVYFRGRWCAGLWLMECSNSEVNWDLTFLEFFLILGVLWLWAILLSHFGVTIWQWYTW